MSPPPDDVRSSFVVPCSLVQSHSSLVLSNYVQSCPNMSSRVQTCPGMSGLIQLFQFCLTQMSPTSLQSGTVQSSPLQLHVCPVTSCHDESFVSRHVQTCPIVSSLTCSFFPVQSPVVDRVTCYGDDSVFQFGDRSARRNYDKSATARRRNYGSRRYDVVDHRVASQSLASLPV